MNGATRVMTRRIDSGDPLFLVNPPTSGGVAAYAVSTAVCSNPKCSCTTMWLSIRPAWRTGGGGFEIRGPVLSGQVSADGSGLKLGDDTAGTFPPVLIQWLLETLSDEDHRDWLRERWRRARGQAGDPSYPSGIPPEDIDWMVSFSEVFPYDFDLTVVHERRLYLADDQYCLQPACTCKEVLVHFVEAAQGGRALGHARASVRRPRSAVIQGAPLIQPLWNQFLGHNGSAPLRERFKRMRSVVQTRVPPPRRKPVPSKVGRNAPCPCGSGKKFKRCCSA